MKNHIQNGWRGVRDGQQKKYWERVRDDAKSGIDDLVFLATKLPEDQLGQIFTDERLDRLISTLLTQSDEKSRSKDPHLQDMIKREYRIAAMLMQKGTAKCFERVDRGNHALWELIRNQAQTVLSLLIYIATEGQTGKRPNTSIHGCSYNSKRYEKD